jgi:hypothetical protein
MQKAQTSLTLPNSPQVGEVYVGPTELALQGLTLSDPMGTWPTAYTDSSITWTDDDNDGHPGVTSIMLIGGTSSTCHQTYAGLPIPSNPSPSAPRATRVYTGSRNLGYLDGKIIDCDTIVGKYRGTASGWPQQDGRVTGCLKSNNQQCTAAETASLDSGGGASGGQTVHDTRFALIRLADAATCSDVRGTAFPPAQP